MRRLVRICGQPFGDRFCTIYQLLLVVLAEFFYIDIFSIHFFWICRIQLLPQVCGGKPCTVCSTSHSPTLLEPVPIQPSLTWSHCVSFRLHYSPACNSSQFSTSSTFSPHTFFWIFHIVLQDEDKEGSLPHQVLLFTRFFCWNVHSSSFCTEGAMAISISCYLFSRDWKSLFIKKVCSKKN